MNLSAFVIVFLHLSSNKVQANPFAKVSTHKKIQRSSSSQKLNLLFE